MRHHVGSLMIRIKWSRSKGELWSIKLGTQLPNLESKFFQLKPMHPVVYNVLGTYSLNLYSRILRVRPSMFVDFPSNIIWFD